MGLSSPSDQSHNLTTSTESMVLKATRNSKTILDLVYTTIDFDLTSFQYTPNHQQNINK